VKIVHAFLALLFCVIFACSFRPSVQAESSEELPVRELQSQFLNGWAAADSHAISALFSEDADLVIPTGLFVHGRGNIDLFYSSVFASGYKGSRATSEVTQVRFLKPDVAIVDGKWSIDGAHAADGKSAPAELGIFSLVTVKQDGSWRIAALREQSSAQALRAFSAKVAAN
jgi:uncharacterized protein (TIGR02246 family)